MRCLRVYHSDRCLRIVIQLRFSFLCPDQQHPYVRLF
uniref:Uncharacterized protein n=1 Tax=Ophiostoma novo-ulmi TaxID=42373 RepID=Q96W36_OPHNO|nr:unknown [Ophiostoma novo-ulmi]